MKGQNKKCLVFGTPEAADGFQQSKCCVLDVGGVQCGHGLRVSVSSEEVLHFTCRHRQWYGWGAAALYWEYICTVKGISSIPLTSILLRKQNKRICRDGSLIAGADMAEVVKNIPACNGLQSRLKWQAWESTILSLRPWLSAGKGKDLPQAEEFKYHEVFSWMRGK